ncbi:DUF221 domain containing membrane protein [Pseudohyphozyma bogoriensis]|nr:DUF221 domain containing membrane protein [Pseudohyphozyma bogoriensis]
MDEDPSPGLPPGQLTKYNGPWFLTQLLLSISIGLGSFIFFSFARRVERWKVLYSPRTLLKGFSPHEVHDHQTSLFGWILPTIRTSEFTVLQIVGLDAAVLLSFFRTSFYFFLTCTCFAGAILVPINYRENGTSEGVDPPMPDNFTAAFDLSPTSMLTNLSVAAEHLLLRAPKKIRYGSTLYLTSHLIFTYFFTILALWFLQRNYARYIPLRQLFSLELAHSIPARTVLVTGLPPHLRSERAIVDYFEGIQASTGGESTGLGVESVDIVRAVGGMKELLERRTRALQRLEGAWQKYLGNPVPVEGKNAVFGYDPAEEVRRILEPTEGQAAEGSEGSGIPEGQLVDVENGEGGEREFGTARGALNPESDEDLEARLLPPSRTNIINPARPRPMLRPGWFSKKVDALDFYAAQFRIADEDVRRRRMGKFRPTGSAFVTFQSLASAQIAAQIVHYPTPGAFRTELAPEPRDVQWFNLSLASSSLFVRRLLVLMTVIVLLSVWSIPVAFLAKLLSWDTIEDAAPKLAKWIAKSPRLRGFVQTSLPSLAMVAFNNFLPFFLETLSVFQGLSARSWVEYSLMKKYHLSILFTTLFVFITSSTYSLLQEISESPAGVLTKLATTLPGARNFFVSYVMLSGLAIMPLQLLELAVIIPRFFFKLFITRTPRDYAELNAPPTLNLGTVYPQALLIFTLGVTYSIISPLILPFATLYFAMGYLVYKYKLLFVYYRPYESRGQAWPLAFNRIALGLVIFQVFMLGLFTVRKAFLLSGLMVPLLLSTIYASWRINDLYSPLSQYVNVSQASEMSQGGESDIVKLRKGHPVTKSQSNLQRSRYSSRDEGVYVVQPDSATDYQQPPLSESYPGVLNTGRRRYGHPALSGSLPEPWLPGLAEPTLGDDLPPVVRDALVVDLRRRWSTFKRVAKKGANVVPGINIPVASSSRSTGTDEDPSRAWRGSQRSESPIENDPTGVFSDEEEELEEGEGLTGYGTFWPHHPSRNRRGTIPGTEDES